MLAVEWVGQHAARVWKRHQADQDGMEHLRAEGLARDGGGRAGEALQVDISLKTRVESARFHLLESTSLSSHRFQH